MHELSLCRNIFDIINEHLTGHKVTRVKKINLNIGRLTGIAHAALRFSYELLSKGTMAEAASLEIILNSSLLMI